MSRPKAPGSFSQPPVCAPLSLLVPLPVLLLLLLLPRPLAVLGCVPCPLAGIALRV